ncbi:MAG: amidohydrolase [Alphaproteobacteria bacterium]|jgi:hippurate hydrolase|nr:amidohydrolase [Alphaproteobacteria bacterium]
MPIINSIAAMKDEMTEWRRDIHAHPEIAFEEVRTAGIVADKLKSWGLEVHTGIARTGVVGVLRGNGGGGRSIGLRADMDALPMDEENDFPHKSRTPGKFHGCGHDGHTTMLLGAAKYLAETRNFDGTVTFIFQPGEEGAGGGRLMVEEGLFDRFDCDEVYALHNWPDLPVGEVGVKAGPMMAASDLFDITITGKGGHAAMPHKGIDPVVVAAQLVTAFQSLVTRRIDPLDPAVISVTQIHTGSAYNVVPAEARLNGTVRTLRADTRDFVEAGMARIVQNLGAAFEVETHFDYRRGYPPTVNPEREAAIAREIAESVLGDGKVHTELPPVMGAEDFAYMLEARPGAYLWVGQAGGPGACSVHNPRYDFNDDILPIGSSLLASLVEQRLPRGA